MRKLTITLLAALAVVMVAVACGDDDDNGDSSSTPTETAGTASARPSPTEDGEASPTNGGGDKTPAQESPDETTPVPTEAGPQPTPAAEGTPATFIEDPAAYFNTNYPNKTINESPCGFSPVTYIVTCDSVKYAPNPPLAGQDVSCALLTIEGAPVAIRCTSQQPLQSIYYEIQE